MRLAFTKMHGAANDFVVMDARGGVRVGDLPGLVRRMCDRRRGVGADGVLLLEAGGAHDFRMAYWNADGGRADFCGNGARCIARFAIERGVGTRGEVTFATDAGVKRARALADGRIALVFGAVERGEDVRVEALGRAFEGRFVVAGVPHLVIAAGEGGLPALADVPLMEWAPPLRRHEHFGAAGTNVDFVQRLGPSRVAMRTYERGVEGETLACGSGSIATALWALSRGEAAPITVRTAGGDDLVIELADSGGALNATLSGPAEVAYEGRWDEPDA